MFIDVRKARLNARMAGDAVYVPLPVESGVESGLCEKLMWWLYGMRVAAQAWEKVLRFRTVYRFQVCFIESRTISVW